MIMDIVSRRRIIENEVAESLPEGVLCFFPSIAGKKITKLFMENKEAVFSFLQERMKEEAPSRIEVVSFLSVTDELRLSLLSRVLPDRTDAELSSLCQTLEWSRLEEATSRKFGACSLVMRKVEDGVEPSAWGMELTESDFWQDLRRFSDPIFHMDSLDCFMPDPPKTSDSCKSRPSFWSRFSREKSAPRQVDVELYYEDRSCESRVAIREKAERIREEIVSLQREHGIDVLVDVFGQDILQILENIPRPKLSKLQVTDDFRIFLQDYNNREVTFGALERSLYFLFLLHPEGIRLKELDAYENQLMKIYKMVSNREDLRKMQSSIAEMVEPGSPLCQQKLARVRAAFRKWMNVDLEVEYTPNGKRGERYSVRLDRSLLSLPESLLALK